MPIITDKAEALRRLSEMIAAQSEPVYSNVEALLDEFPQASLWEAEKVWAVGELMIPTASYRTGRRYVCVTSGTGASTESARPAGEFSRFTDGTAVFEEAGMEIDLWDLRAAAFAGVTRKMAMATPYTDGRSSSGEAGSDSQLYAQLERLARLYAPCSVA